MNAVAAAVLTAGVALVEATLPGPEPGRPADHPREVRDRLLRAVALGAVLVLARRAGRAAGGRARRGRRGTP